MFPVATIATGCRAASVNNPNSKLSCGSSGSYIDRVVTGIRNPGWIPRARLKRASRSLMTTRFLIWSRFGFSQLGLDAGTSVISVPYCDEIQRSTTGTVCVSSWRARSSSGTKWIRVARDALVAKGFGVSARRAEASPADAARHAAITSGRKSLLIGGDVNGHLLQRYEPKGRSLLPEVVEHVVRLGLGDRGGSS